MSGGEKVVTPMPEINEFACKFIKQKTVEKVEINGKTKKKKNVRFGFTVANKFFEASDDNSQKIFSALGIKKAFNTGLRLECSVYDLAVSDSGIEATVVETLDYGNEKFLKCNVGGSTVYLKCDDEIKGDICLLPDFEKVGVVETQREIKII